MYLHLGGDTVVRTGDILFLCDLDTASYSRHTRDMLRKAEKEGRVVTVSEELPKSFVFCAGENGVRKVYLSQLNSATLVNRVNSE